MTADTELGDEQELWNSYLSAPTTSSRELLIVRYMPLANRLAAQLYAGRQVYEIEFNEFRQYALLGLIESIDRYDPDRGASFSTYSSHRIRGAILNGIEKHCEKQQQISARTRLRQERFGDLLKEATTAQQDPLVQMIDAAIGIAIGYLLEDSGMHRGGDEGYEHNVYSSREMRDLVRSLDNLVGTLPEQERNVIRYHYYQHIRFDQIAEVMGLSKGRISQIHHSALRKMRENYDQLRLLRIDY